MSQSGAESLRIAQGALADGPAQIFVSAAGLAESELTDRNLGGELGAAIDVSNNMTDRARRDYWFVSGEGLTDRLHIQHKEGDTLNQTAGQDFFTFASTTYDPCDPQFRDDDCFSGYRRCDAANGCLLPH